MICESSDGSIWVRKSMKLADIIRGNLVVTEAQVRGDRELVIELQIKLRALGLYPGGQFIDGDYGGRTRSGLKEFCAAFSLPNMNSGKFDRTFAEKILTIKSLAFILAQAQNRSYIFDKLLGIQRSWQNYYRPPNDEIGLLAFLDRTIEYSTYANELPKYPERLQATPDGINTVSHGATIDLSNPTRTVRFSPYPDRGQLPESGFDRQGLEFLDPDITEACVCVGSWIGDRIYSHWSGRNALRNVQFWSATKFIPILNVVCLANAGRESGSPTVENIDNCNVRGSLERGGYRFADLVDEVVTYGEKIDGSVLDSNRIAAMFKRFETYEGLERWLKGLTGNNGLTFRGNYGQSPFRTFPRLYDRTKPEPNVILEAVAENPTGRNLVSAYDLTRLISMVGWHRHISDRARLPGVKWQSLSSVIKSLGKDRARYLDVAIETPGLGNLVSQPVIISKLGLGDNRDLTYVAFCQFIDERLRSNTQPAKLRTLAMALRVDGTKVTSFIEADVRMAAEVTEITRRVVTEEFA
jgi:peptidoglycan hydrolase-like protein with peptidoglycan-binding domain